MEIRILGAHSSEAKGMRMPSLLVDDVLALDAGGLTSSLSISEQQKIKAILLTHHHFDHTRDLLTFGFNGGMFSSPVEVYALHQTLDIVNSTLLNGRIYVDFTAWPSQEKPFLQLKTIELFSKMVIANYEVLAVPVHHSVPAVGYCVTSENGRSLFYTGDTGPGLSNCWEYTSPQLLIIEVAAPNRLEEFAKNVGHMTAGLLKEELIRFRQIKDYLPHVIVVHIAPYYQNEIEQELNDVAQEVSASIDMGYEDMQISL